MAKVTRKTQGPGIVIIQPTPRTKGRKMRKTLCQARSRDGVKVRWLPLCLPSPLPYFCLAQSPSSVSILFHEGPPSHLVLMLFLQTNALASLSCHPGTKNNQEDENILQGNPRKAVWDFYHSFKKVEKSIKPICNCHHMLNWNDIKVGEEIKIRDKIKALRRRDPGEAHHFT